MHSRIFVFSVALTAIALVASACSGDSADDTTTTTSTTLAPVTTVAAPETTTTTETPETTTTTTEPELEVADSINGLPASDDLIDRRVIAVKIDNHPKARPQSGLQLADAVYEIRVEGGLTRFIALFHQNDSEYVGPNRSGRPTDAAVLKHFDPVFQVSGAQPWVQKVFRAEGVRIVYDNGVATYRISTRSAPQNLYMSTEALRGYADDIGWADDNPGNLFPYGEPTQSAEQAEIVTIEFSDADPSVWHWDGEMYQRFIGDEPHMWVDEDGEQGQIAFDTVVAMKGQQYVASPPSGSSGSSVPATKTTGSGDAYVFSNGTVTAGTWSRETTSDPFDLFTEDGDQIVIAPGRIWISIVPDTRPITWE
ncbi:MAG: DUF3048 domain-containing protein [Acidimicrobiia bacterium]